MTHGDKYDTNEKQGTAASEPAFSFDDIERIFLYFSTSILEKNSEEEILWDLAKNCISQLNFVDCVIYMKDEERQLLIQKAAYGPKNPRKNDIFQPIEIPLGQGITGSVARWGVAENIGDTSKDTRYIVDDADRMSEIAVPIVLDEQVIGVIDCEHPDRNYFTDQHLRILKAMSSICAIKISRLRAEQAALQEKQKLLEAHKQMEQLKAKAMRTQMNPHFLFNALNAVQYFITVDDKKLALSYMSLLGKLMRYRLEHFQEESALLSDEIQILSWYFSLQKMRYEDKFSYEIITPDPKEIAEIKITSLVLPLVLESAVEAAMHFQAAGFIKLRIDIVPDEVSFELLHNIQMVTKRNGPDDVTTKEELEPWRMQVEKLNALQHYQIREKTTYITDESGQINAVKINLNLPILE